MTGQAQVLTLLERLTPRQSEYRKVRIGSAGDGGYVLPDDLAGISKVLSIGVGNEASFDRHFADREIAVYQYDPTVEGPPQAHGRFFFHKIAWVPATNTDGASLAAMIADHGIAEDHDALLKFDVEGAEWDCLAGVTDDLLKPFRIIVCELHGLHNLGNPESQAHIGRIIGALTRHHTAVHLHANNCCGMTLVEGVPVPAVVEVTLLRNDRSKFSACHDPIPGPLDYPNMNDRPDLVLTPFASPSDATGPCSAIRRPPHVVLCDGGLCNRLNALVFALVLRQKYGHAWEIAWPRNNWCNAGFDKLFDNRLPVSNHSLLHFKAQEGTYRFLMHENQADIAHDRVTFNRDLASYEDYRPFLDDKSPVLYYNSLIPSFVTLEDIASALRELQIKAGIRRQAEDFCHHNAIDTTVLGLHIRKTDFGAAVDDQALHKLVRDNPNRFFVCSDDPEVNLSFSSLPNCCVFPKTSFPEKILVDRSWQHDIIDDQGRPFPFNVTRSEESIVEALIDLLILSRTRLVDTSPSTFLRMAMIMQAAGFFAPSEPMESADV